VSKWRLHLLRGVLKPHRDEPCHKHPSLAVGNITLRTIAPVKNA
jgi:hypothetical protein